MKEIFNWLTILYVCCLYTYGQDPNVTVYGFVHENGFRLEWMMSDRPHYSEFLMDKTTYCAITTGSNTCHSFNCNILDKQIQIFSKDKPMYGREYGCEMVFQNSDRSMLIYTSGVFLEKEFQGNAPVKTPIGNPALLPPEVEDDEHCDKTTEDTTTLSTGALIGIIVACIVAIVIIIGVALKCRSKRLQSKKREHTSTEEEMEDLNHS